MNTALSLHNGIIRRLLVQHSGYEMLTEVSCFCCLVGRWIGKWVGMFSWVIEASKQ